MAKKQATEYPWDQQPGENGKWFSRFWKYCQLGPNRTVEEVYRQEQSERGETCESERCNGTWYNIASEFAWRERAEQYDDDQRQKALAENAEQLTKARERHRRIGVGLMQRAMKAIEALDPATLSPREAIQFLEFGRELELAGLQATAIDMLDEKLKAVERIAKQRTREARRRRKRDSDAL